MESRRSFDSQGEVMGRTPNGTWLRASHMSAASTLLHATASSAAPASMRSYPSSTSCDSATACDGPTSAGFSGGQMPCVWIRQPSPGQVFATSACAFAHMKTYAPTVGIHTHTALRNTSALLRNNAPPAQPVQRTRAAGPDRRSAEPRQPRPCPSSSRPDCSVASSAPRPPRSPSSPVGAGATEAAA